MCWGGVQGHFGNLVKCLGEAENCAGTLVDLESACVLATRADSLYD